MSGRVMSLKWEKLSLLFDPSNALTHTYTHSQTPMDSGHISMKSLALSSELLILAMATKITLGYDLLLSFKSLPFESLPFTHTLIYKHTCSNGQ